MPLLLTDNYILNYSFTFIAQSKTFHESLLIASCMRRSYEVLNKKFLTTSN
jgi:hypothetical protein